MLKTDVLCNNFLGGKHYTVYFFPDSLMKRKKTFEICIINVFTVTFDQFNASLQKKKLLNLQFVRFNCYNY